MTVRLYDTLTRGLKEISSSKKNVSMYSCGPTVYRDVHVGNLRTFLLSDLIRRTLQLNGYTVNSVQNITDVGHLSEDFAEDKILKQSQLENSDPFLIARKYEQGFHQDLAALNILPADHSPRASDHIQLMQQLISKLIELGHAYIGSDESVYFSASSYPKYGEISRNRLDALKPGHRYEYTENGAKHFHADWALWKAAGNRIDMIWDSPWSWGFPGWHIECSAMSLHYLNNHVNIHVGGIDLRFPHHENERAQSNSVMGNECVDLWVHGEHLLFEGRKMSKSSGNVVQLKNISDRKYDPLALRFTFLENRYQSQMNLSWESIEAANTTLKRWRALVASRPNAFQVPNSEIASALNEDLDTPRAIQVLRAFERNPNSSLDEKIGAFLFADQVLGLDLNQVEVEIEVPAQIQQLLDLRTEARSRQDWNESDRVRIELELLGLEIQDTSNGQEWAWRTVKPE